MDTNRPATEEELKKYAFLNSLLKTKPEKTKPSVNAELWVQYKVVKSDNAIYTYTITNRVTPDGENENQKYVISGIVKDLTNRTETDHESRMMGHLREIGYFHDSKRPTKDEMRIVKYNNDLYIDPSKSGISSLFKNTIKYLFFNNLETTKERVRKLFQYTETVITIIDENPKATIQKLVKSPRSMIIFPEGNNTTDIQERHQRKNNMCFVNKSETTKALDAIARSIEDFPHIANIVNKSPDELNVMLSLSTLSDQVDMVNQNLVNNFGDNMVKGNIIEQLELKLNEITKLLKNLDLGAQNEKLVYDNNSDSSTSKRIKVEND